MIFSCKETVSEVFIFSRVATIPFQLDEDLVRLMNNEQCPANFIDLNTSVNEWVSFGNSIMVFHMIKASKYFQLYRQSFYHILFLGIFDSTGFNSVVPSDHVFISYEILNSFLLLLLFHNTSISYEILNSFLLLLLFHNTNILLFQNVSMALSPTTNQSINEVLPHTTHY